MESYLLKSSVCLVVLYVLYKLVLKHETNHHVKRIIGLLCILFACGFLFIPLGSLMESDAYSEFLNGVFIISSEGFKDSFSGVMTEDFTNIYLLIYTIGLLLFGIRSLIGLGTLVKWYFISEKIKKWGFTVVQVDKKIAPFTFFNTLYIGNEILDNKAIKTLIIHEQYHRDQWHSLDTVLLEILTVFYWFNPAVWLFQKEMKTEHEYMADAQVLKEGVDALDYQYLLFQARTGTSLKLGSQFSNKTNLKKRFKMMNTKKTRTSKSYVRAFAFLPIMALILIVSAFTEANENSPLNIISPNSGVVLDTVPSKIKIKNKKQLKKQKEFELKLKSISSKKKQKNIKFSTQPLFILKEGNKEKVISSSNMGKLTSENIESVTVLKDKAAIKKYGEKGKNGVVIIVMKKK